MKKLVLIDGNSIMNRAFYGIMGSKALTTKDGKYSNAIYGFLAILFKLLEDEKPDYIGVSFDLKAPTARHKIYEAVKQIAQQNGYDAVVDRSSAQSIIFASPRIDISNEVLSKLGYSN